jgi:hypothetical protein
VFLLNCFIDRTQLRFVDRAAELHRSGQHEAAANKLQDIIMKLSRCLSIPSTILLTISAAVPGPLGRSWKGPLERAALDRFRHEGRQHRTQRLVLG